MQKFFSLICLGGAIALTGCGTRQNDPVQVDNESLTLALQQAIDYTVIAAVDDFQSKSIALQNQADTFCTGISGADLHALQDSWRDLYRQWFKLANYNFGPLNDDLVFAQYIYIDSLRLNGQNYLSTVRDAISADLASTDDLNESYFDSKNFDKVGLLALESAIFETSTIEHSTLNSNILDEYQNESRKCEILTQLALQVKKHADYVYNGWHVNHKSSGEAYRELFLNDELDDGTNNLTQLISSVQEHLDYLKQRHVASTGGQVSDDVWNALSATVDEIETLLKGTNETSISFFTLMESAGYQYAVELVQGTLDDLRTNISAQNVTDLETNLGLLDGYFKREIPDSLAIDLGLNFSDGD